MPQVYFKFHVEVCQGEISPTSNIHIPPPPVVLTTPFDSSSHTISGSVERNGAPTNLDILRKVVRDTLNGSSQTTRYQEENRSYWQNEAREVVYNGGLTPSRDGKGISTMGSCVPWVWFRAP